MKSANLLFIITGRNKMLARLELLARVVHVIALTVHDKSRTLFQFKEKIVICFDSCKCLLSTSQQNHQRWINVETTLIVNVDFMSMNQCCFNVEICLKMKVELAYVYRRCFNVALSTTLTDLRRFKVNDPMLFRR